MVTASHRFIWLPFNVLPLSLSLATTFSPIQSCCITDKEIMKGRECVCVCVCVCVEALKKAIKKLFLKEYLWLCFFSSFLFTEINTRRRYHFAPIPLTPLMPLLIRAKPHCQMMGQGSAILPFYYIMFSITIRHRERWIPQTSDITPF